LFWGGRFFGGCGRLVLCGLFFGLAAPLFEELLGVAFALFGWEDLVDGGEWAEFGVAGEVFDQFGSFLFVAVAGVAVVARGLLGAGFSGEEVGGDLEAVEDEAGALLVELVGADAVEDLAEGVLDGGAVFKRGEEEFGVDGMASAEFGGGVAGGLVVVAEVFVAEGGAAAAAAGGEDVAAAVGFLGGFGRFENLGLVGHGGSPLLVA